MPPPAPRLCLRAAPHGDSVLSVAFSLHSPLLLASGGEDCALLLHDLRICSSPSASASTPSSNNTSVVAAAGRSLFADPIAALAWQGDHVLYCGSGNRVYRLDTRKLGGNGSGSGSRSGDNNHASSSSPSRSPSSSSGAGWKNLPGRAKLVSVKARRAYVGKDAADAGAEEC